MAELSSGPNCVHHGWQPALGPCSRCGDYVCVRCAVESREQDRVLCRTCADRESPSGELLPWDGREPWLRSFWETSVSIAMRPRQVFGALSTGPVVHAWTYATCWMAAFSLCRDLGGALTAPEIARSPIAGALRAAVVVFLLGTLHHVAMRIAGARANWKLSCRTAGYATPWVLPAVVASVVSTGLSELGQTWHLPWFMALSTLLFAAAYASTLFIVSRARMGATRRGAIVASVLAVSPFLALVAWSMKAQYGA